ncbi:MAG: DUF2141 domain-containing protein [Cytophagales bacterium]|nr:DUF2141 domain-containing protein [Cytophagales bacterium]
MMRKQLLTILGLMVATLSVLANDGGKLTIIVKNVASTEGIIQVTLFDDESNWLKDGELKKITIDNQEMVSIEFENVPDGTYAVSVVHDANANGDLDKNSFGMPTEAYGFSNEARGMFGPPDFDESKFEVKGDMKIEITVK